VAAGSPKAPGKPSEEEATAALAVAEAANAYLGGDHKRAQALYEELAKKEPDNEAYAAMVRIIARKSLAGGK